MYVFTIESGADRVEEVCLSRNSGEGAYTIVTTNGKKNPEQASWTLEGVIYDGVSGTVREIDVSTYDSCQSPGGGERLHHASGVHTHAPARTCACVGAKLVPTLTPTTIQPMG